MKGTFTYKISLWTVFVLSIGGCILDNEVDPLSSEGRNDEKSSYSHKKGAEQVNQKYVFQMLSLVNSIRTEGVICGRRKMPPVRPLTLNQLLNEAASLHAEDMAENGYFRHVSLDGRNSWDRMKDVGYFGRAYGENIAAGNPNVEKTFNQWVKSRHHCRNMMSSKFSELGVGYSQKEGTKYNHYWVLNFGHQ